MPVEAISAGAPAAPVGDAAANRREKRYVYQF